MTDVCAAPPSGFISSIANYFDCQAQILGSGAWQALGMPGSTLALALTGFLTIFIALFGYRLLLGSSFTIREMTLAFVKIGAVFSLATSWPAYRTIVYDLITDGPAQMVAELGPSAGLLGSDGTLLQHLDMVDQALAQLAILGIGNTIPIDRAGVPPPPFGGFDAFALGGSRILFELSALGGLATVRIVAGLMLALGPFFIAFLMFDATRSLFEGWLRVLAGSALAILGVSLALAMEIAFLEPWLSSALARRMAGQPLPSMPTELFVLTCLFVLIVMAVLLGCTKVMNAFRLPATVKAIVLPRLEPGPDGYRVSSARAGDIHQASGERTRAAAIAGIIRATGYREISDGTGESSPQTSRHARVRNDGPSGEGRMSIPLGRSFSRRAANRVSGLAARRDGRA
jgi:type IV secretion system protein VirB6